MVKSTITGKEYNPDNSSVIYVVNVVQAYKYLQNGASEELVDILYTNTKNDCLVFVFRKSPFIKKLYEQWNNHEL
ncbi:MAG: hypothetical protein PUE12_18295 [Oscillospiraceae bacterium]|nr:hypothetical protein [Oscillospiraceae bacterium]